VGTSRKSWFQISNEGWRRLSAGRPLARLVLEGIQNSFDTGARHVEVAIRPDEIVVEDDAPDGIGDLALVYTVFLTDKEDSPLRRGRMGRGLKELIAAMDVARVETVGSTIVFDRDGRHTHKNERTSGTRLVLLRTSSEAEIREAEETVRHVIPPEGTELRLGTRPVRRPEKTIVLTDCELETVVVRDGMERYVERPTTITLYAPRRGQTPHLFEMGIPIEALGTPWHVDVGQRVPTGARRMHVPESYKLRLKHILLELLIVHYFDRADLGHDWVADVLSRCEVSAATLDAYVSRVFPRGAVLGGSSRANDKARQLGAHVVDVSALPRGLAQALERAMPRSDDFVRRREAEAGERPASPTVAQRRFARFVVSLAEAIAGQRVRVRFVQRRVLTGDLLETACTDPEAGEIRFNVLAPLEWTDPTDPTTLGIVLHEIAHLECPEHDRAFIDRLQLLAGRAVRHLGGARRG
jgi:hypothetical protein